MGIVKLIRELLAGLEPEQVQAFIKLLLLIFGGSVGPAFATGPNDKADVADKEQLKSELIAKGCSTTDADTITSGL